MSSILLAARAGLIRRAAATGQAQAQTQTFATHFRGEALIPGKVSAKPFRLISAGLAAATFVSAGAYFAMSAVEYLEGNDIWHPPEED